ncbi:MAG TPA: hypothetical protein VE593_12435 [Nitrososphaeraceae archaeon]|nr:hypothetical protein [Nitrososphaeraceae archaeon]
MYRTLLHIEIIKNNKYAKLGAIIAIMAGATLASAIVLLSSTTFQITEALINTSTGERKAAPTATSEYKE